MTTATLVRGRTLDLPPALETAQHSIHLPDVQEMLRRLSVYGLGVCMPHAHDERTSEFQPLPAGVVQVESSLTVSFQASEVLAGQGAAFLPVAWHWRDGGLAIAAACEMADAAGAEDVKHKMILAGASAAMTP